MIEVPLTEARRCLGKLIARVEAGEDIRITRRGRPVAQLTPILRDRKPIDVDALRRLTDSMTMSSESAADLVRRMRDEGRY